MSRDSIKMVAMLTMLINHIANVFLPAGQVWEAVGCAVPILVSAFVILYLYNGRRAARGRTFYKWFSSMPSTPRTCWCWGCSAWLYDFCRAGT